MASIKNILLVHPKYGELINETFVDETQFKIFLKMIHTALALGNDFTTYNGKDFLIHVPTNQGAYGLSEDAHLTINHIITSILKNEAKRESIN